MRRVIKFLSKNIEHQKKKSTSYDTSRAETNTPQNVREGEEPEAIRQRLEKAKGK